jgi:tRNA(Ile)-lysidine synthase
MVEKVLSTIKKHSLIEQGESIVVGVSGGPDSVCLLNILHSISGIMDLKIFAVHINHMMRASESDADENYVKEFCKIRGITLFTEAVDIKEISKHEGISVEEAGREARYRFFKKHAQRTGASKIAIAHNKNDQTETVLMNIIRGTGLNGLKGIDYKLGPIIRPLLDIERREIEEYCNENSLNPRTDSSNNQSIYTRNKIRLDLIPYIDRMFQTNITESVYRMAGIIKEDIDFIDNTVSNLYNQCIIKEENDEVRLNWGVLKGYHIALMKRIIRNAVKTVKGNLKGVENKHIESTIELAFEGNTGSKVCLTDNIRIEKSYNILKVYNAKKINALQYFEIRLDIPGSNHISMLDSAVEADIFEKKDDWVVLLKNNHQSFVQFFDYEKLKTGIYIRYRNDGDIFKPFKSNGTKKLKEYFIDNKVPRDLRDTIPLISSGNEIVWIIGYKISDKFKVTENTKYILKLEYKHKDLIN